MQPLPLPDRLERLYARRGLGIRLRLENEAALLARLGNPQQHWAAVHVAGTNGKGSVCAIIDSVLRAAGYKTGLYTSPHLLRFNERFRVNGICISDAELTQLLDELEAPVQAVDGTIDDRELTFFEITTALGFEHFRRKGVEIGVIETGMGGRLDATNVLTPRVSVITRVSLEHTIYLGTDLAAIAREKAGIIKPGVPVVCGPLPDEALNVVIDTARARGATLVRAAECVSVNAVDQKADRQRVHVDSAAADYGRVEFPLLGKHQLENCAIAVATLDLLGNEPGLDIPADAVREGLRTVFWPARFQFLSHDPPVVLDVAHNPEAGHALAQTLKPFAKRHKVGLVFAIANDKDIRGYLKPLAKVVDRCWAVPMTNPRGLAPEHAAATLRALGFKVSQTTLADGLAEAEAWAKADNGFVCIAGSLFLAGDVLALKNVTLPW
ncbi:MAG: bifunctional folylpolyglutamate synthase/dihydrofolate synthase [Kiritimatiellae bacterium]|nr:bifunctional folylpolyglutamate synthase/dihydrofolate synthase [Kiritimatiellia bacterium]